MDSAEPLFFSENILVSSQNSPSPSLLLFTVAVKLSSWGKAYSFCCLAVTDKGTIFIELLPASLPEKSTYVVLVHWMLYQPILRNGCNDMKSHKNAQSQSLSHFHSSLK